MKRLLLIILAAGLMYTALWFWIANNSEKKLAELVKTDSVSVTGFPKRFRAEFVKPQITIGNVVLTTQQKVLVERNLPGSKYAILLPHDFIIINGNVKATCHFTKPAEFSVVMQSQFLEKAPIEALPDLLKDPKFYHALRFAEYKDHGAYCVDEQSRIYRHQSANFQVRNERRENRGVMDVKGEVSGDVHLQVDAELDGYDPFLLQTFPDNSELQLNMLSLENHRYGAQVKGYVKINKTDIFPYGLIQVRVRNLSPLLDDLYQRASAPKLPSRAKLEPFLLKLSHSQPENVMLPIERKNGGDLVIGDMRLGEFIKGWRALFADNHNRRAK